MIQIGVDPSLNSTGVCINYGTYHEYFILTPHLTRKMREFHKDGFHYVEIQGEEKKDIKIWSICDEVRRIIRNRVWKDGNIKIVMEGVSYGSVGSRALVDLSGLNFSLRTMYIEEGIDYEIVPPSQWKKQMLGNGSADKKLITFQWKQIEKDWNSVDDIKIDDLSDSYFLSHYTSQRD